MMRALAGFLQVNGLTTRQLLDPAAELDDSFEIKVADVTADGLEVIKAGLNRWIASTVDKHRDPNDTAVLDKALEKIRSR
jgi:hypothetical protein